FDASLYLAMKFSRLSKPSGNSISPPPSSLTFMQCLHFIERYNDWREMTVTAGRRLRLGKLGVKQRLNLADFGHHRVLGLRAGNSERGNGFDCGNGLNYDFIHISLIP